MQMMAKGRDVSDFYPDVVRNVIVKSIEVKKLVYTYLVHHADANATCRELALLAINSFQRDLSDSNQLIRGLALRVLCGIRVREIVQIQIMSVKKCASDSSPFVRKSAAHCVGKIHQIDPDTKGELVEIIDRLLGDKTTAVLSSAIAAFNEVCPEELSLLHKHYRTMCALLADFDEWGQIAALTTLTRYARTQFANPEPEDKVKDKSKEKAKEKSSSKKKSSKKDDKKKKGKKGKGFYSEDEDSSDDDSDSEEESDSEDDDDDDDLVPKMSEDHQLLLRVSLPLLRSRNSGVVLAVATLHHYAGPRDRAIQGRIGRALVRIMRGHREVQYIILSNLVAFAKKTPELFRRYLKDFFIAVSMIGA
jgi:AP-3 complex subunit beta